ncbi:MAG: glycosyltransferase family 39 protein [Pirellulales bacterium]|nr:glycosyltransferase family 39 protein [Pirellulales bacterium]
MATLMATAAETVRLAAQDSTAANVVGPAKSVRKDCAPPATLTGLLVILLVGLLVRALLWSWFAGIEIHDDERDYDALAVSLALDNCYRLQGQTTSIRPPLYPFAVSLVYRVVGVDEPTDLARARHIVRALQAVLSLATVCVVYRLGIDLFDGRVGLWAAAIICFYPSLMAYNNLILTEVLFTFWLTLAVWLAVKYLKCGDWRWAPATGAVIGLGSLARSALWMFPPVLGLFWLVLGPGGLRSRLAGPVLMIGSFAVVIGPWAVRNTRLESTFITIDSMGGRNIMMGNYEYTPLWRAWDAISIGGEQAWYRVLARRYENFRDLTQGQRDKLAMREGVRFVLANPGLTARRDAVKFFNFWQLEREVVAAAGRGLFGDLPTVVVLLITLLVFGSYALLLVGAIIGAIAAPPSDWRAHLMCALVIAFLCALHTVVFAHSRYHLPLVPILACYAAQALVARREIWARRRRRLWVAVVVVGVFVAGWLFEIAYVDFDKFAEILRST